MKLNLLYLITVLSILSTCSSKPAEQQGEKHVFYLHGRIIEEQGKNAFSEKFGQYAFDSIVVALKVENAIVHAEIRKENVDARTYAKKVSAQIDSLILLGVKPIDITVVGASKGAIIAAHTSDINEHPVNYVFLAGNNDYQEANNDWKFHGQVLCIYDLSDGIAGKNYDYWKKKDNHTTKFEQLEIKTNLGHGFLYKPLDAWVKPTKSWILRQRL
ncbi:MAG: hypothetical protein ACFB0B_04085 [Thermonemataceae bacterium]